MFSIVDRFRFKHKVDSILCLHLNMSSIGKTRLSGQPCQVLHSVLVQYVLGDCGSMSRAASLSFVENGMLCCVKCHLEIQQRQLVFSPTLLFIAPETVSQK